VDLSDILAHQRRFDAAHSSAFRWDRRIDAGNSEALLFLAVALAGEVGEIANLAKKVARGDCSLPDVREQLIDEFADVFIYVLKSSIQLGFDLEQAFLDKLGRNVGRFRCYEDFRVAEREIGVLESTRSRIRGARSLPFDEMEEFARAEAIRAQADSVLVGKVTELLVEMGFDASEGNRTSYLLILALMLSEVAEQRSPSLREYDRQQIERLCEKVAVSYPQVVSLSRRASDLEASLKAIPPISQQARIDSSEGMGD
jgi:NTP pyrophosphatase (non-canonical NTP hydrolase)